MKEVLVPKHIITLLTVALLVLLNIMVCANFIRPNYNAILVSMDEFREDYLACNHVRHGTVIYDSDTEPYYYRRGNKVYLKKCRG